MTTSLSYPITLTWQHRVIFTRSAFACHSASPLLEVCPGKVLVCLDEGVAETNEGLVEAIQEFFRHHSPQMTLVGSPVVLIGGEACKNDWSLVEQLWSIINERGIDRHSTVLAIGGGAFLDLVGFAAATAHRGIRLVRMPTTTLSMGDGGVGVKNGVNSFGKKNWIGTFAIPTAVVNDFDFLRSAPEKDKRGGLIEAVKVALLRDANFFRTIEERAHELAALDLGALEWAIEQSAAHHLAHIATGGDPFELGSARPLDFGHWVAHRIEPLSHYAITHGEAVAIGMAVDLIYASLIGLLDPSDCDRILTLLERLGFDLWHDILLAPSPIHPNELAVIRGLEDFREHLGGQLTITLITAIGQRQEVHEMNHPKVLEAISTLRERCCVMA